MPRPGSKLTTLLELLEREEGAAIEQLAGAVGWQAHSVRGVLSATLKKQFGDSSIKSECIGGGERKI